MTTNKLPQCWDDAEASLAAGIDRIILYGMPGTGKTFWGLTAGDVEAGAHRLICAADMTTADVTGFWGPSKDGFTYEMGAALKAWIGDGQRGGRLVIDEIDLAGGDVLAELLAMTDTLESAVRRHPVTGDEIRPNEGFAVIMTTNLEDPNDLPAALRDRFPVAIKIDQPHPEGLNKISPKYRSVALGAICAEDNRRVSLRAFYAFEILLKAGLDEKRAARLAFSERAQSVLDAATVDSVESK